jgi:glycosyltransferase involved in cell wall biosynthesis
MCRNPNTNENCEKCLGGKFINCVKGSCIHSSKAKSLIGCAEAEYWKLRKVYRHIDKIICCSAFMKTKLDTNPIFAEKTVALHNFVEKPIYKKVEKKDYVLYFGRFSEEKGVKTLIEVAKQLPEIKFIFAGTGTLDELLKDIPNIENVGFKTGEALEMLIREAKLTVYPAEWYENCPFSVIESQMYLTPVIGADIGGIPELIKAGETGELFESGNAEMLKQKILDLYNNSQYSTFVENCRNTEFIAIEEYCSRVYGIV